MSAAEEFRTFRLMLGGCPEHNAVAHWQWACLICPASRCYAWEPGKDNLGDARSAAEGHVLTQHGADALPRMRVAKGRVMHVVEQMPMGWLRSKCRKPLGVKGIGRTVPRVTSYAEDWTSERGDYPDCKHCPTEVSA